MLEQDIFIVCKETNLETGQCIVYDIGFVEKNNLNIGVLHLRERYNLSTLRYYAILEQYLENKDYIISLIKKDIKSILYTHI